MDVKLKVSLPVTGSADFTFEVQHVETVKEARTLLAEYLLEGHLPRTVRETSAEPPEEPTYLGVEVDPAHIDYDWAFLTHYGDASDLTMEEVI